MQYQNSHFANDWYHHRNPNEEDLAELARRLDFPMEDILRAVQEAGSDREAVEEYIRGRYNRA